MRYLRVIKIQKKFTLCNNINFFTENKLSKAVNELEWKHYGNTLSYLLIVKKDK